MAEATPQTPPVDQSGRLIYADPRTLPSFPSIGLKPDGAAAGAAATLGWNKQKTVELWKPHKLSSASAAAVLAKDYKMAPSWEQASDAAGHQAALLAVGSASTALKRNPSFSPESQEERWYSSAASQAFHASRSQSVRKGHTPSASLQGDRSLAAAKGAMASGRPRATSTPALPRPSESHPLHSRSALNGATVAHRASMRGKPSIEDSGAIPVTAMTRNMFTSHPMVKPEVDEQHDSERLHQSAVEMAKKMYNQQQRMLEQAKEHGEDLDSYTSPHLNLQDAAYKQAQERLARLHDEHLMNRELQEYYGNAQVPRRRFSVVNKLRRRSSADEAIQDREQSERIRRQMSMFSSKLSEVDKNKRQQDRDDLLAAAQRNVKARLNDMDENVYHKTGKVNPTLLSDWELRAQQMAQTRYETQNESDGKINLGGGMFMDQGQVDAIAARRMQPVLDDINEKAEKERERLAELKMEEDAKKAELERQKERDRDTRDMQRRVREEDKEEEKARKQQEKEAEKARKEKERADKAEQKRLAREGKRQRHDSATSGVAGEEVPEEHGGHESSHASDDEAREEETRQAQEPEDSQPATAAAVPATETEGGATAGVEEAEDEQEQISEAEEPTGQKSRVRGWIRNRLSRGKSFSEQGDKAEKAEKSGKGEKRRSFFRGGVFRKSTHQDTSTTSFEHHRSSSMRDVALAGKSEEGEGQGENEVAEASRERNSRGPVEEGDAGPRSRKDRNSGLNLAPPRPLGDPAPRSSSSPGRDSRFREEV